MKCDLSTKNFEKSRHYLAGGVSSSLRSSMKPVPLFATSGKGSRLRDVDGNEYVDYLLAYGPLILGHCHPQLTEDLKSQMKKGYTYGLQHAGEIELAKLLVDIIPSAERVTFSGSGTEAVMLALRIAKSFTKKTKIVRFQGHYHGWSDSIFTSFPTADMNNNYSSGGKLTVPGTSGQSEKSLEDIIVLPWNNTEVLEETLYARRNEIAAVITEPVMCNSGCILPKEGYLERMRELTEELGIILIFDEVITGFRLGLGGAQGRFNIKPDLTTMGKAIAGGIPLSAVGGRKDIMALIEEGKVNHLGTLNGNPIAVAAAISTINILSAQHGAVFDRMERTALDLVEGLRNLLEKHQIKGVVNQIGPVFHLMFTNCDVVTSYDEFMTSDSKAYQTFAEKMLSEGVLIRPNGLWYISTEHSNQDVKNTLEAADRAIASLVKEYS
ncbi:aspartate aminotransferase family protein [Fictibacillus terranigra]|uniref:Aspartate aminotransferase family protein n=1 Tax=Fictibacillus terranigra TaxID=3058424 RepID=A0ABT8EDV9_9BACL|nr:aspartate aminotransferase family protein [Fictibacillus sp. CENA-BCM004]MDN4075997.1 aspartate aminotransferase family protein [Fictibacillus sp. CENA-BCM004]